MKIRSCGPADFTAEALADTDIRNLMSLVTLIKDEELESMHPSRWPARVEITTKSGRVYTESTDFPRGDPENPVTTDELAAKFHTLADGPWGKEKADFLAEAVLALDNVENVTDLF